MTSTRPVAPGATATTRRRLWRLTGVREILLLAVLYVAYSVIRTFASDDFSQAVQHATALLNFEQWLHIDVESWLNDQFHAHRWLEVAAAFYYAAAHYLLTPLVIGWLWFRRREDYFGARTALVAATVAALGIFVLLPTAPPRLYGGYHDGLALTSDVGWWSTSASAPEGLGNLTNELAAMPSMHVGWAVWVALVLLTSARQPWVRVAGVVHALLTSLVVIGTGNHWLVDGVVGAGLVVVAWLVVVPRQRRHHRERERRRESTRATLAR